MDIDHIHFYVENATQMRDWFCQKMGLQCFGTKIVNNTKTKSIGNENLLFLVSSPVTNNGPVADYLNLHPPGVVDIAFRVKNLDFILAKITQLGIKIITQQKSKTGQVEQVKIQGWGDYFHTLIQEPSQSKKPVANHLPLLGVDHLVLNVEKGQLAAATKWYQQLFGFQVNQVFNIQTSNSGLYSEALVDSTGKIRFNINEPSTINSQIQTFLDHHQGAGIQHIGLSTTSIFTTIKQFKANGLSFLPIPKNYYLTLKKRAQTSEKFPLNNQQWQALESLQILLDWTEEQPEALLLQIFTKPIFKQPTFFFEFIERRQEKQGFGEGNFLALFEAIEQVLLVT
ncbi:MAG: 4-hydroxyphenylpyruvate dioxygenase [Microcystaceae cyanobacterium]